MQASTLGKNSFSPRFQGFFPHAFRLPRQKTNKKSPMVIAGVRLSIVLTRAN
jgi:hypothetical protein